MQLVYENTYMGGPLNYKNVGKLTKHVQMAVYFCRHFGGKNWRKLWIVSDRISVNSIMFQQKVAK